MLGNISDSAVRVSAFMGNSSVQYGSTQVAASGRLGSGILDTGEVKVLIALGKASGDAT
jgi:hypothetical protein